jgi:hypothetical protein
MARNVKVKIYTTVFLTVDLRGCENWSLILRDGNRLRVFENRVVKRVIGRNGVDVMGDWRRLHDWELHNFYSSPDTNRQIISRRMR